MRLRAWTLPVAIVAFLTPPASSAAQDVLPLDRAVTEALARNPGLRAAGAGTEEAAARVDEARAGFFPRVTVSEAWQRGNAPVFVFSSLLSARQFAAGNFAIDALNNPDPLGFFHGAISVDQLLFDGGRTSAGVTASRSVEVMAGAERDDRALALAMEVSAAYGRVLTAETARQAADAAVAAAEEDVARAERRRDAGTVTDADVLALQVHLAAMRQQSIESGGRAAIARADLNRLRGAPVDEDYRVQEPAPAPVAGTRDWRALAAEAQANRPDIRRGEAAVEMAAAARQQASGSWWPQVAAQATWQYDGLDFASRASSWVIGGEARWTFSTGMGQRAAARASAASDAKARALLDEARAAVDVDVLSAVRQLESAEARAHVASATVAQARERQRIVRNRYDAGMAGVQDVLGAAAAVLDAETTRVGALADRITAQAALDRAIGRRR